MSHGDTPNMQNLVFLCQRPKTILPDSDLLWIRKYKFRYWGQRSYRGHECTRHIVTWWYTHVSNIVWPCQRTKKLWPEHKAYRFDLEIKGQCRVRIMNVRDTSSHGDRPMCQIWYDNVKQTEVTGRTGRHGNKTYEGDLKVKGQRRIGVMNVRDTLSHSDTSMSQIW